MSDQAIRISIFNHKGGVGKTVLTLNIAAALACEGKKVLLVDSDPQCNLTAYLIEDKVVDSLLDGSDKPKGGTLWSALKPVSEGTGPHRLVPIHERGVDNLFVLPGDIRLSEFELQLGLLWPDCFRRMRRGLNVTTALSALVESYISKRTLDFVFYDTGPNIGPLNRVILLDCDYFIVPVACDLFSRRALSTLGQTLKNWISDWQTASELAPDDAYLLPGEPRFLGYIPQQFRTYGQGMTRAHAYYLSQIQKQIHSDIIAPLREIDRELAPKSASSARLGQVKDFSTLVLRSQAQGVPLWQVTGGNQTHKSQAKSLFGQIAKKLVEQTGEE